MPRARFNNNIIIKNFPYNKDFIQNGHFYFVYLSTAICNYYNLNIYTNRYNYITAFKVNGTVDTNLS
jgi:hypothetical protein